MKGPVRACVETCHAHGRVRNVRRGDGIGCGDARSRLDSLVNEGWAMTDGPEIVGAVPFETPTSPQTLRSWLGRWSPRQASPEAPRDATPPTPPARSVRLAVLQQPASARPARDAIDLVEAGDAL